MAIQRQGHPSADVLKAFGLGKLDDSSSSSVMDHLDQCPDCRKQVTALSGDDFLNRLRQVPGSTPVPVKPPAEVARAAKPAADPAAIANLPPELTNNPHYEVLRELGRGGMGVVYLARNRLMDRLEVLKVVNKTLLNRPGALERFLREIRAAAKLNHVNVVAAYHALQVGDLLAFAMEYVEGQDLAGLVKSQGPLPITHACFYIQQAAHGLQHAFEKHMVHRDIKPQNLILAREGRKHIVKVLDFGLAKATREKSDESSLTGEGNMLGTPDYIAPEQSLDAAKADIRADIYSLGCTLYFLLAGRAPFTGNSLSAVLLAHQMQEAKPLSQVRPEVPKELAAVVVKMMAKSPAQRYQTPLEVVQALAPFVKPGSTPKAKPAPAAEEAKEPPEPLAIHESRTEDRAGPRRRDKYSELTVGSLLGRSYPFVGPRKSKASRKPRDTEPKKWLIGGAVAVGVLLLALLGMWAGGVFKVKTNNGTIVLENLPPDAEVTVEGEKVTLQAIDGSSFAIGIAPGKKQRLQVTKEGFTTFGEEVKIEAGGRRTITVRLEPLPVAATDAERRAAETSAGRSGGPKADYDALATGRWIPLLPSQEEFERLRSQKSYLGAGQQLRFARGILETKPGVGLIFPINATNVIVRTRVRKLSPKGAGGIRNVGLSLRRAPGKPHYDVWFNGGGVFGVHKWDSSHSPPAKNLAIRQLSEDYEGFFELAFAALGDQLTVYANGRRILEAHGREIHKHGGSVMVSGEGLFQDIEAQVLDPAEKPASGGSTGFLPLFNGKDLTGWKTHPKQPGDWRVVQGTNGNVLTGSGPATSHLYSELGDYTSFHLRVEARINDGGNSGVSFRALFGPQVPVESPKFLRGYEAQINSTHGDPNKTGSLYAGGEGGVLVRIRESPVPAETWFTMEVIVEGNHIVVKVNGKTTADFTDEKRRFTRGHIALQQHNPQTVAEFRKIEIKELPPR